MRAQINIVTDEQQAKKDAEQLKEQKIADEASDAIAFDGHPFWTLMKRDLLDIREKIVNKIMDDETLTKYQEDKLKVKAKDIKLFLEHPKLYVKRLQDLLARKRIGEKRNNNRGRKGNTNG